MLSLSQSVLSTIPATDPKQCAGSRRIMYSSVGDDDDGGDDDDVDDDDDNDDDDDVDGDGDDDDSR